MRWVKQMEVANDGKRVPVWRTDDGQYEVSQNFFDGRRWWWVLETPRTCLGYFMAKRDAQQAAVEREQTVSASAAA